MNMNKTYIPIAPDKPIALNERQVLTYLPKLAYSNPGVMKFTAEHFVINNGEVVINQQFVLNPRILVSLDEPTLDSVQMWYKWLYNYMHLGGNITDTLSIADDLDGFGNAQAAVLVNIALAINDSATGKSATIFLNAAVVDTLKIADSQPIGMAQYILNSNLLESLRITTNTPTGVKQLNYISDLLDNISISAVCFGVKQLNYQTAIVDELVMIDDTYGVKQLNLLSLITDKLLIIDNTYGVEAKDGKFAITDSIVIVDQLPTGERELFDMAVLDDQIVIEDSVSVIAQLDLTAIMSDTIIIVTDSTGIMQEFHVAPHLAESFTIIDSIIGISQHSMNSDMIDNLSINDSVSGIGQQQHDSSTVDSIQLTISADGLSQINKSSNIEDSLVFSYIDPIGVGDEYLYEVNFYGKDSAPPDTPLKTQFVLENKHATPPTPPIVPGFEFHSWDGIYTYVTADVNIYAIYSILYYSVTFLNHDNSEVYVQTNLTYGQSATPPTVTRTGWTFSHWTVSYQNITGNVTTKAVFTINTYTITWLRYNGVPERVDSNIPYDTILNAPLTGSIDDDYYNYSWPVSSYTVRDSLEIWEIATQKTYRVRWYYYGGTDGNGLYYDDWVLAGQTSLAPTNTATTGYYTYSWPVASISDVTSNQSYTETRAIRYYTVTWNRYNGVPERVDSNQTYDTILNAPLTGSTDDNYYNYSWPVSSYTVRESLTITEVATPITYTVIWKSYAGATLKTDTLTYGQTSTAPTGTADDANWDYSWPKSSHTVPYSTTITETRTAMLILIA